MKTFERVVGGVADTGSALRSPVLDEVLSGWRAEAPKNASDPEYEVRLHLIV